MRLALAAILGLVLALPAATASAQTRPVTLVVPQTNEAKTLSPGFAADTGGYHPTSNIYSTLVVMDWGVVKGVAANGDRATSASLNSLRRPCAQQAASVIGPGLRPGAYKSLNPA